MVVDARGLISRKIFTDEEIYRLEMERVFQRCWLFLAHTTMLPQPGSFVANYAGEEPVIVWRDADGKVGAFLNTCPHRGNKLCLFDAGKASTLTCSYHGWTFNNKGQLTGVPFFERAYFGDLDRAKLGLIAMPRVQEYAGLIFGTWDADAPPLDQYLGEMRWWLDVFMPDTEVVPGAQRYHMPGNWKLTADNFVGDGYHVPTSHASAFKLAASTGQQRIVLSRSLQSSRADEQPPYGMFTAALAGGHGLGGISTDVALRESDARLAQDMDAEAVDFVKDYYRRLDERMAGVPDKPSSFNFGACFPNLLFQGSGVFQGRLAILAHPRGPHATEMWQWLLIDRHTPTSIRRKAALNTAERQAAAGLIGVDDGENFERIAECMQTPMASKLSFHYGMAVDLEDEWPGRETWHVDGLPGRFGPSYAEVNQRAFYRRWGELMGLD
ncbi:MAG: Rieske 2Fe-2S domain-containing protein [Chloroflexi bacterium]|nr:Rieske 2Fe-2S domain-containing protein [Chloroflexota bacterium]